MTLLYHLLSNCPFGKLLPALPVGGGGSDAVPHFPGIIFTHE